MCCDITEQWHSWRKLQHPEASDPLAEPAVPTVCWHSTFRCSEQQQPPWRCSILQGSRVACQPCSGGERMASGLLRGS